MAGMGLWYRDPESRDFVFDERAREIHGMERGKTDQLSREGYLERVHPDDLPRIRNAFDSLAKEEILNLEYRWQMPDGATRWLVCSGNAQQDEQGSWSMDGCVVDISARKVIDEQFLVAQKMEAVGQLTAGIAHNFNNILSAILPNLHLASRYIQPEGEKFIRDAKLAAERASALVSELMIVAGRRGELERDSLDLNPLVERIVRICRTTFGGWLQLIFDVEDDILPVIGNESQMEQVLLNLLINARDALEGALPSCPRIVVELEQYPSEVVLRVRDNGGGMNEETQTKIFDPFFSTKDTGTGLGLATAFAIVGAHKGRITVASELGQGSCIEIFLPISDKT